MSPPDRPAPSAPLVPPRVAQEAVPPVAPSRDDPLVAASSEVVGGPLGRYAAFGGSWWTPLRVLLALTCVTFALGLLVQAPCRAAGPAGAQPAGWSRFCSELPALYRDRGLGTGGFGGATVEHPGLQDNLVTGAVLDAASALTRASLGPAGSADDAARAVRFFDVMALVLLVAALATVVATAATVPKRPYDAALVAAAPVLLLTATAGADLLPVALVALAVLAWSRDRPAVAGVLLGLAAAAAVYPVLLLWPVLFVSLRQYRAGAAVRAALGAAVAWLAVSVPVWVLGPDFASFSRSLGGRTVDVGSFWYALQIRGHGIDPALLGPAALLVLCLAGAAVGALALRAPSPPRLAQLGFLLVAAAVLSDRGYPPERALWLLPLAALARPRWRDLLVWQAGEVVHLMALALYLNGLTHPEQVLVDPRGYAVAIWVRGACLLWLASVVVRDVLRPSHDPVRAGASVAVRPAATGIPA